MQMAQASAAQNLDTAHKKLGLLVSVDLVSNESSGPCGARWSPIWELSRLAQPKGPNNMRAQSSSNQNLHCQAPLALSQSQPSIRKGKNGENDAKRISSSVASEKSTEVTGPCCSINTLKTELLTSSVQSSAESSLVDTRSCKDQSLLQNCPLFLLSRCFSVFAANGWPTTSLCCAMHTDIAVPWQRFNPCRHGNIS